METELNLLLLYGYSSYYLTDVSQLISQSACPAESSGRHLRYLPAD